MTRVRSCFSLRAFLFGAALGLALAGPALLMKRCEGPQRSGERGAP